MLQKTNKTMRPDESMTTLKNSSMLTYQNPLKSNFRTEAQKLKTQAERQIDNHRPIQYGKKKSKLKAKPKIDT